jgi:hypothetical protein
MGLESEFEEVANDVTGQGGSDGQNNATNSNGSNDKTEDTMVDSGNDTFNLPCLSLLDTSSTPSFHERCSLIS